MSFFFFSPNAYSTNELGDKEDKEKDLKATWGKKLRKDLENICKDDQELKRRSNKKTEIFCELPSTRKSIVN